MKTTFGTHEHTSDVLNKQRQQHMEKKTGQRIVCCDRHILHYHVPVPGLRKRSPTCPICPAIPGNRGPRTSPACPAYPACPGNKDSGTSPACPACPASPGSRGPGTIQHVQPVQQALEAEDQAAQVQQVPPIKRVLVAEDSAGC